MNLRPWLLVGLLSLSSVADAESSPVNRNSVWFKPSLAVNSAPICEGLLGVEQETFFSVGETRDYARIGFTKIRGMYDEAIADPQVHPFGYRQWMLTLPDGQQVFAYFSNNGGCGGACETEQILVADKSFDQPPSRGDDLPGSPLAAGWDLFKSAQGDFYALGAVHHRLQAYRVAAPGRLELACEVTLRPAQYFDHDDASVRDAWQAVEAMLQVYGSIAQDAGYCGSLNAAGRNGEYIRKGMEEALYRPWTARGQAAYQVVEIGGKLYGRNHQTQLEDWSLTGLAEYRAFQRYLQQRERSAVALGKFYQQKFGWNEPEAKAEAGRVLLAAFDRGFGFSSEYNPGPTETVLRQAILERQPLSAIENREVPRPAQGAADYYASYDSLLNVAVEYPEALQYLLKEGLDPNVVNGFGKTPLMYAAQYNQLESVRILLAAGADPNAATHIPEDHCPYTLKTGGMTPLHYAARYASAALIRLLVAEGAATFAQTRNEDDELQQQTPLDWLNKYTGNTDSETNPHIAASELAALTKLLCVPRVITVLEGPQGTPLPAINGNPCGMPK